MVILELIHATKPDARRAAFIRYRANIVVIQNNLADRAYGKSFKFLPYQLSMVRYWLTMVTTGNGELGFDSGEGA